MYNPFQSIIKNKVLPLSVLKKSNPALFAYYLNNRNMVRRRLNHGGIQILHDIVETKTYTNIKLYLQYHYGRKVNMNILRERDYEFYQYLKKSRGIDTSRGKVIKGEDAIFLRNMGFEIEYTRSSISKDYFLAVLRVVADDEGFINNLKDANLYSKIYYRAKKDGLSIVEYLESLGFKYGVNKRHIIELSKLGYTKETIAKQLGISTSCVARELIELG